MYVLIKKNGIYCALKNDRKELFQEEWQLLKIPILTMLVIFLPDPLKTVFFFFFKQMAILIFQVRCHSYHLSGLRPKIKKSYSNVTKESYAFCWIMFSCLSWKL